MLEQLKILLISSTKCFNNSRLDLKWEGHTHPSNIHTVGRTEGRGQTVRLRGVLHVFLCQRTLQLCQDITRLLTDPSDSSATLGSSMCLCINVCVYKCVRMNPVLHESDACVLTLRRLPSSHLPSLSLRMGFVR